MENGIACRLCYSQCCLFPAGDVLLLFVVVGIVLFIVRKWSDKAILITAIFFSLQPIEWFHYIMSLFNPAYTLPDLNVGAMYAEVAAYTKGGNFWEFLIGNVTLGQKASLFWAIGADVSYRLPDFSYSACTSDANSYSSPPNLI